MKKYFRRNFNSQWKLKVRFVSFSVDRFLRFPNSDLSNEIEILSLEGVGKGFDEGVGDGVGDGVGEGVGTVQLHFDTLLQSIMVLLLKSLYI